MTQNTTIEEKNARITKLEQVCQFTLNLLNTLTTDQFSKGEDKSARDKLEDILGIERGES